MNLIYKNAILGALVADAFSMPVHWYYNTNALDRDFPKLNNYSSPLKIHPDSILWRSKYTPRNQEADILHEHAKFWGKRGVHYHQFLKSGENTLNYELALELIQWIADSGSYNSNGWLKAYVDKMRTPGWNKDTYLEEYHREFFDNRSKGKDLDQCGVQDIHIGGLTQVPFLLAALDWIGNQDREDCLFTIQSHLSLTHHGKTIKETSKIFTNLLQALQQGAELRDSIDALASNLVSVEQLETWSQFEDRMIIGRHLTSACYLPQSFVASLFLAWKYHDDFKKGVQANALCGGDNCHRGVVVGALLGAVNTIEEPLLLNLKNNARVETLFEPTSNQLPH